MNNYKEKDKNIAAALLLCKDLKFEGSAPDGEILAFEFSPYELARKKVDLYISKRMEPIQPKDFSEALASVMDMIFRFRNSRNTRDYQKGFYK